MHFSQVNSWTHGEMKWGNLTEDELKKGPEGVPPGPVFYQVGQADEAASPVRGAG